MSKTRGDISIEVTEIAGAASRARSPVPRALDDMEQLVYPGAREIATLSVIARSQDWQFKPLMEALVAASKITDWSHHWMVAQNIKGDKFGPRFNWKDAPYRKYKSFENFYARELEATFGRWEDLLRTWDDVVKGKITEAEGREHIARGRLLAQGRPGKGDNTEKDITLRARGTGRGYTMARLDRDRPDLAARVDAGKMTANAAAIEAGFRKKAPSRKQSTCQKIRKLLDTLTHDELQWLLRELRELLEGREAA
jgi:hypothetical protein